GCTREPRPRGFAFGDTAFRVFLLMASRRLKSDRFFTTDYTPQVYTPTGLRWIDDAAMSKVLLRHFPQLDSVIRRDNAFKPWRGND
ncbi:MAG: peroxidase family protein, partial [Acidimicrobiia bacterium]